MRASRSSPWPATCVLISVTGNGLSLIAGPSPPAPPGWHWWQWAGKQADRPRQRPDSTCPPLACKACRGATTRSPTRHTRPTRRGPRVPRLQAWPVHRAALPGDPPQRAGAGSRLRAVLLHRAGCRSRRRRARRPAGRSARRRPLEAAAASGATPGRCPCRGWRRSRRMTPVSTSTRTTLKPTGASTLPTAGAMSPNCGDEGLAHVAERRGCARSRGRWTSECTPKHRHRARRRVRVLGEQELRRGCSRPGTWNRPGQRLAAVEVGPAVPSARASTSQSRSPVPQTGRLPRTS